MGAAARGKQGVRVMPKLKLNVRQIRQLQEKHGIPNLLVPGPENTDKVANVTFLADFYYEGSRSWGKDAPTVDAIEEMDLRDLLAAFQAYMSPAEGNG